MQRFDLQGPNTTILPRSVRTIRKRDRQVTIYSLRNTPHDAILHRGTVAKSLEGRTRAIPFSAMRPEDNVPIKGLEPAGGIEPATC